MNQPLIRIRKCEAELYYVKGVDRWEQSPALGFGDFVVYNLLVLYALPPSSSITTKMCLTFVCIISVHIGFWLTHWLRSLVNKLTVPGVPMPVITVSIYLFILNLIIPEKLNQCIELQITNANYSEVNELFSANKSKISIHL